MPTQLETTPASRLRAVVAGFNAPASFTAAALPELRMDDITGVLDENKRLRDDSRLLAFAWRGITPDRNTQTEAEVDATEEAINDAAMRATS